MLRNCVILAHTNMLDATHLVQINMDVETQQPVDSAGRFVAKNHLKKKQKMWLHKTMQIPAKIDLCCPALQIV